MGQGKHPDFISAGLTIQIHGNATYTAGLMRPAWFKELQTSSTLFQRVAHPKDSVMHWLHPHFVMVKFQRFRSWNSKIYSDHMEPWPLAQGFVALFLPLDSPYLFGYTHHLSSCCWQKSLFLLLRPPLLPGSSGFFRILRLKHPFEHWLNCPHSISIG